MTFASFRLGFRDLNGLALGIFQNLVQNQYGAIKIMKVLLGFLENEEINVASANMAKTNIAPKSITNNLPLKDNRISIATQAIAAMTKILDASL